MAISLDSPVALTKLDAVNVMLRIRGESEATALGSTARKSVQDAEAHLAQTNLEVQSDEWNFNKEYKLQLDISVDDSKVYLPSGTLKVEPTWTTSYRALVQRGNLLYDQENSTYLFDAADGDIYVNITIARAFEELAQPMRWYIALLAASTYGNATASGDPALRITSEQLAKAKAAAERYDNGLLRKELPARNPHFARLRGTRGTYR